MKKFFGVLLIALLTAGTLIVFVSRERENMAVDEIAVYISVSSGNHTQEHTVKTDEKYLGNALLESKLVKGDSSEYGILIKEVSGIEARGKQWWRVTKENKNIFEGVNRIEIKNGDIYEITLMESY